MSDRCRGTSKTAESVVAYHELRKPTTMGEIFEVLQEAKIISATVAQTMKKMVGFRNIIAHDYERVNYGIVYEVLHTHLDDIRVLLAALKKSLA